MHQRQAVKAWGHLRQPFGYRQTAQRSLTVNAAM
jgi:hypothetical protein